MFGLKLSLGCGAGWRSLGRMVGLVFEMVCMVEVVLRGGRVVGR